MTVAESRMRDTMSRKYLIDNRDDKNHRDKESPYYSEHNSAEIERIAEEARRIDRCDTKQSA